jgi:hypothetical protein
VSTLSLDGLAQILRSQGFSEDRVPTMLAIAQAESGGNPRAHNPNAATGDNSYGLFQVNMLGGMGPERRRQFGISSNEELFDPATNARVAKGILESQGFGAWSVYKGGQYKQHLGAAEEATRRTRGQAGPSLAPTSAGTPVRPAAADVSDNPLAAVAAAGLSAPAPMAQGEAFAKQLDRVTNDLMGFDPARPVEAPSAEFSPAPSKGTSTMLGAGGVGLAALQALLGEPPAAASPVPDASAKTSFAPAPTAAPAKEGSLSLLQFGRQLRDGTGLRFAENAHPDFGGKVGGHSSGSLHYQKVKQSDGTFASRAWDVTDWRAPGEPESVWRPRKAALEQAWQGVAKQYPGTFQIFGPSSDPKGHGQHIHLGVLGDGVPNAAVTRLLEAEREVRARFPLRG